MFLWEHFVKKNVIIKAVRMGKPSKTCPYMTYMETFCGRYTEYLDGFTLIHNTHE